MRTVSYAATHTVGRFRRIALGAIVGALLVGPGLLSPADTATAGRRSAPDPELAAVIRRLALTRLGPSATPLEELPGIVFAMAAGQEEPATTEEPAAAVEQVAVTDTRGQGANLRGSPGWLSSLVRVMPEGEVLTVVGGDQQAEGRTWRNVRDANGNVGWVVADLLVAESRPAPVPVAAAPQGGPQTHPQIDGLLMPAWRALTSSQQPELGPMFQKVLQSSGVKLTVGPLPRGTLGLYQMKGNQITISRDIMNEDVRVVATVMSHEMFHARQVASGMGRRRGDCVAMEVEAIMINVSAWDTFWKQQPPNRTEAEQFLNREREIMYTEGEPGIYKIVVDEPGYQMQCQMLVPD